MKTFLLFLLVAFACAKTPEGYIVTAQYWCVGALCPEVEINTARIITDLGYPFEKERKILNTVIPASQASRMQFPLSTAVAFPLYFTAASQVPGYDSKMNLLFTTTLANDLSSGNVTYATNFTYTGGALSSLETYKGQLLGCMTDGALLRINFVTGSFVKIGNLLPQGKGTQQRYVTSATSVDEAGGRVFALTRNAALTKSYQLSVFSFATGNTTYAPLGKLPFVFYDLQNLFSMSWVSNVNRLVVFSTGNFDQLYYFDPNTTKADMCIQDLSQLGYKFRNQPSTFDSDLWRNDSYDPVSGNLYFQATQNEDQGIIQLLHVNFEPNSAPKPKPYIDQDAEWTFGNSGIKYVRCIGECQKP